MSEHRLYDWALAQPWAIRPDVLELGLRIALREGEGPEAVAERLGRPLENAHSASVREGGVAVIPVIGPIFPRANLFTEISGGTSIDVLARDLRTAADDPGIRAIVLDVDSPGGQVTGTAELAGRIREASKAKPVIAYGGGNVASGAYWLASAADALVVSPTAALGSIGVVAGFRKPDGRDRTVEIVSSLAPNKRVDVTTDAGRAEAQRVVDDLHDVFERAVAEHRGVPVAKVRTDFGRGGLLIGARAVAAGMADRVGDFESLVAELAQGRVPGRSTKKKGMSMSWQQNALRAIFGGGEPAAEDQPTRADEVATIAGEPLKLLARVVGVSDPPAVAGASGLTADERAELERFRAQQAQARLDSIGMAAVAFADAQIKARKATPAERKGVALLHATLAVADAGIGARVDWDGDHATGTVKVVAGEGARPELRAALAGLFEQRSDLAVMFEEKVEGRPVPPAEPAAKAESWEPTDADRQYARSRNGSN